MRWIYTDQDPAEDIISHLLRSRGIEPEHQHKFLNPTLADIHDFHLLHDSATAAKAIADAIKRGAHIFIHGDYDVDGVCATALMWEFIYRIVGYEKILPFIPSRFDDGYGLSRESLSQLIERGANMIISVDCGVKDVELVKEFQAQGLEFVITDHHQLPEGGVSEQALAVVHPRNPRGAYPFTEVCGTTVAWKTCQALAAELGIQADLDSYLELVALATVCDVMPLVDENRAIVKFGLEKLKRTSRAGLQALMRIAKVEPEKVDAYHLGFVLGPRLNAAGRVASAMTALKLLTTTSESSAAQLAAELDALNQERQALTKKLLIEAELQVTSLGERPIYFVHGISWPEGIIGLIAGKLAEKYQRPVLVGSETEGVIVGSARSPVDFHLADTLKQLDSFLLRHGGHALAAGFSLSVEHRETFTIKLEEIASAALAQVEPERSLKVDAKLPAPVLRLDLVKKIEQLAPFGFGNQVPVFSVHDVSIERIRKFGKDSEHIGLMLRAGSGESWETIAFGGAQQYGHFSPGDVVDVAGNLRINSWNNRETVEIGIKDIRAADRT